MAEWKGWLVAALASACTFSAPQLPGAEQSCVDWYTACRDKQIACGRDPAAVEADFQQWIRRCQDVIWSDTADIHDRCIPAMQNATCEESQALRCGRFASL